MKNTFLVAAWPHSNANWGIYLADAVRQPGAGARRTGLGLAGAGAAEAATRSPIWPDQVDLSREQGLVYLHDVQAGPGLKGVPRGTVKRLRVLAYHFGYPGLAGPDRIGFGGPWEVMRILGTVPVEADGSAFFRVPANTPIALQPLDAEGQAVQLHAQLVHRDARRKGLLRGLSRAPRRHADRAAGIGRAPSPRDLTPWHGPARGFDFEREVQPVLDRHCVPCHDGASQRTQEDQNSPAADLAKRPKSPRASGRASTRPPPTALVTNYSGRRISQLGIDRMPPKMRADTQGMLKYSPAYEALIPYLRRVGLEDDVSLLTPGEYHANTSPLIQMLRQGHHGVNLDAAAWDRLVTWIDLNAPCHGTWGEVYPIPDGAHERRMALRRQFGGPPEDPEEIPSPGPVPKEAAPSSPAGGGPCRDPDSATTSSFVHSEAVGSPARPSSGPRHHAQPRPPSGRRIPHGRSRGSPMNVQFRASPSPNPSGWPRAKSATSSSGSSTPATTAATTRSAIRRLNRARRARSVRTARGLTLNGDRQPVVRVSWEQAMAFCRWLSARDRSALRLAHRSAMGMGLSRRRRRSPQFRQRDANFSRWANLADASFSQGLGKDGKQATGGLEHLFLEGAALSDARFNDSAVVTANIGTYLPNAWGLYDMHGNAAEWTRTTYRPYPYREGDPRLDTLADAHKVVRGGSFFDRPTRSRSAFRLAYPPWQRVFNVGFRVVGENPRETDPDPNPPNGIDTAAQLWHYRNP